MKPRHTLCYAIACSIAAAALVLLAGCGPVRLVANTNIPTPLIVKIPVGIALFVPKEFAQYVHREERWSTDWNVDLGKAQTEGITRLMNAMFERVVQVDSINAGAQLGSQIRAILEPSIEEYAFVTPRDAGSPFFAVSIKYRVNVYSPEGKLADSWGFTGYGTAPSQGISSSTPLAAATALAMRDAGAKLAVEFRDQAIVRGLLPEAENADTPPAPTSEPTAPSETETPTSKPSETTTPQPSETPTPKSEPTTPPQAPAPTGNTENPAGGVRPEEKTDSEPDPESDEEDPQGAIG